VTGTSPKVSVIIPSYNHEKFVAGTIRSVLDQSFQDFEIVITDDGSTDGTVSEINSFSDPRIRLFTFERNQGAAVASTNCVSHSRGEYVAMLSSDDAFVPDKLEKQVGFLDEHPGVAAVFSYARIIDEEGKDFKDKGHLYCNVFRQPNRTRHEWLNSFFYNGNCLCHPSVLARRDIYTWARSDPRYAQLGDFNRWIKICLEHDIHVIPEELVKFRVRAGELNASGNRPEVQRRHNWELSEIMKNYLKITSAEEFLRVFPEAAESWDGIEDGLVPFYISMLALRQGSPSHRTFAVETLFEFLGDGRASARLEKKHGFRYIDFIRLTGSHDTFSQFELNRIYSSAAWNMLQKFYRVRNRILPVGSVKREVLKRTVKDRDPLLALKRLFSALKRARRGP
jgi:glycosyltransferase involved in cell wall biosynthesis